MKRGALLTGLWASLLMAVGCDAVQSIVDQSPPAMTPTLISLTSVVASTCSRTDVTANAAGNWEILPSGHPSGDIQVKFQAPWPSTLAIDIGGQSVLREFDDTQSLGEGYYKINAIALATTRDTFDWDVTVTPPASARVETQFQLNIADVSINPAYSGTQRTSAPLALQLVRKPQADLTSWLLAHPNVRDTIVWEYPQGAVSYSGWNVAEQQFLQDSFAWAWDNLFLLLEDPPRNTVALADTDEPTTVLEQGDAWALFASHVAYGLAAEIAGWTSWSVTNYTNDQLATLFDSREMFRWDTNGNGYLIQEGNSVDGVVPASPWRTLLFLYESNIYTCRSPARVIENALEWSRSNLVHFSGGFEAKNMEDQWQYRGCPPVFRIIQGTPFPGSPVASFAGTLHRTAGCWGTTGFLRAVLRVLNIPVQHEDRQGHAMPRFPTEGLYLSHADDPYSRLTKVTPPYPARELLVDQATFDGWFGGGTSATTQSANVGRRPRDLAVQYLPNVLLQDRCADLGAGTPKENSKVLEALSLNYDVPLLDAAQLWDRLDAKIATLGGCLSLPP